MCSSSSSCSWLHLCLLVTWFLPYGSGLIVPNEIPTLLSIIYSNIPPIKLGTDSRVGFGFRLGPHADFQTLVELGPQTNTGQIGNDGSTPSKRQSLTIKLPTGNFNGPKAPENSKSSKLTIPTAKPQAMSGIPFKKVPGIDYR